MNDAPIFVIGAQRSGTTLLGCAIARHPDVWMTVNGKLLYYLVHWVLNVPRAVAAGSIRLDEIAHSLRRRPVLGVSKEALEAGIARLGRVPDGAESPEDLARAAMKEFYGALGAPRTHFGDKYNEYLLCLDELELLYPYARYILVLRHPVPVAASAVRAFRGRPWAPGSEAEALLRWESWNRQWVDAGIPSHRAHVVRYESLVNDPFGVFTLLLEWLFGSAPSDLVQSFAAQVQARPYPEGEHRAWTAFANLSPDNSTRLVGLARTLGYDIH